jgi:hypothetical protein
MNISVIISWERAGKLKDLEPEELTRLLKAIESNHTPLSPKAIIKSTKVAKLLNYESTNALKKWIKKTPECLLVEAKKGGYKYESVEAELDRQYGERNTRN